MSSSDDPDRESPPGSPPARRSGLRGHLQRLGWWWLLLPVSVWMVAIGIMLDAFPLSQLPSPPAALSTQISRGIALPLPRSPGAQPLSPAPTQTPEPLIKPRVRSEGVPPVRKPRTADPEPSTENFIVVDGDSGAILFQRNAFEPISPASLTKIMTAVLTIEYGRPEEIVKVDVDAASFPGSSVMGLKANTEVTVEDLLYGLMLASGNDAAVALARHLTGGNGPAFMDRMNEKAAWLGLGGTHFENPHGFDEKDHYSCPADMVAMARYAMQYPEFRQVVSTASYEVKGLYGSYTLDNVNGILRAYPGADGVKTGDTPQAGRCLVGTAVRDGHRVYIAFMRSAAGAVPDGVLLLDWAFRSHSWGSG